MLPDWRPLDPARAYDEARARLVRTIERIQQREREWKLERKRRRQRRRASKVMAALQAKGLRFAVRNGQLLAGPRNLVVNGTEATIARWKDWFVELLSEAKA